MFINRRFPVVVAIVAMFLVSGCDLSSPDGGFDGDCGGVCGALMASECFYGGGEDDCNTSCNGWDAAANASGNQDCINAWNDYIDCAVSETLPNCGGVATWNVLPCRGEWDHYQNYCVYYFTPAEACIANSAFDAFCAGVAGKPVGKVCRGVEDAGCVVGGTTSNADLYCCP